MTQKPKDLPFSISSRSRLTIDQRTAILEETETNNTDYPKNSNLKPLKQVSEEIKRKILNIKQFVKGSTQDMEGDHIENIFKDKDKQTRYLNYCYEKEGKVVGGIPPASNLTLEELQIETKEFDQIYEMFKNHKKEGELEKRKEAPTMEHRRTYQQWIPEKIVCKRFGVPQPFQGKLAPLNQQKALLHKRNVFETEIQPLFETGNKRIYQETIDENEDNSSIEGEDPKKKVKEDENDVKGLSLELFKSIFDADDE